MAVNTHQPPIRKRRWFQFRLRTLLVVTLVAGVGLGWVMKERRRIAGQRKELTRAGFLFREKESLQSNWHFFVFGDDWSFADEVFGGGDVSDTRLVQLKALLQLQVIDLYNNPVTDAGLVHLKGLTGLLDLNLSCTKITDAGLVHLKRFTNLQSLWLGKTHVTDAGLVHLSGLTLLQELSLVDTQVTDTGIANLQAALPKCTIYR